MVVRWSGDGWNQDDEDRAIEQQIASESRNWFFAGGTPLPADHRPCRRAEEPSAHILLAEDDADMRDLLAQSLVAEGFALTRCVNGIQLLDCLSGLLDHEPPEPFDVIISDIRLPGLTGLDILAGLHGSGILPPTILITAFGDAATHAAAYRAGAVLTLDKPFEMDDLIGVVRRVLDQKRDT